MFRDGKASRNPSAACCIYNRNRDVPECRYVQKFYDEPVQILSPATFSDSCKMRKKHVVLWVFLLCLALVAQAQDEPRKLKVSGGPKVELNMSKYFLSRNSGVESVMRLGVTAGGFLQLDVSSHFVVRGELLYHYKNSYIKQAGNNRIRYWGMEIPIYAMYVWNCGRGHRIYLGAGPYTEFGFSATAWFGDKKIDLYAIDPQNDVSAMRDSNTGFAFAAGYEMPCGLQLNVTYKISISNVLDANSNKFSFYPMTTSFGIAYRFGK